MYVTMNALVNSPSLVFGSGSVGLMMVPSIASRGSTADSTCRSM
ncbi:hypothetical protein R5W24_002944 [Gemmata sp. JC717]|nr:hypothetical protein [Gemmata algarum]MDY3553830.1 hypothetical protein [Gemmata algarum]